MVNNVVWECPRGYPNLAAFLDSDENFMVYRRFGYIQARLLLEKQDELRRLEKRLDDYDGKVQKVRATNLMTLDLKPDDAAPRKEIMDKLEQKFREYGKIYCTTLTFTPLPYVLRITADVFVADLLSSAQQLVAMNKPSPSEWKSVCNYFHNNNPLRRDEQKWIQCREDLVTLRPGREHAWLDAVIEHFLKWTHCSLVEVGYYFMLFRECTC